MRPELAVARNTFTEVLRQPAFTVVVAATILAYAASPWLAMFSLGEEEDLNLLKDFGLSTLLVSGLALACLAASGVIRREIELGTTLTLLAKPVSRERFLVAKFLGVAAALLLAMVLFTFALLLAARHGPALGAHHGSPHVDWTALAGGLGAFILALLGGALANFLLGRSFCSATLYLAPCTMSIGFLLAAICGRGEGAGNAAAIVDPLLVKGAVLAMLGVTVLASFAVSVSVWLGRGGTLGCTAGLFVVGLLGDHGGVGGAVLALLPDFRLFWVGELFYLGRQELPSTYLLECAGYGAAYVAIFATIGSLGFRWKPL